MTAIITAHICLVSGCLLVFLVTRRPSQHNLFNLALIWLGCGVAVYPAFQGLTEADFLGVSFRIAWVLTAFGFLWWAYVIGMDRYHDYKASIRRQLFVDLYGLDKKNRFSSSRGYGRYEYPKSR